MAFAALVNIVGAIFSIVGIVLYALHLANFSVIWMCGNIAAHGADKNCTYLAYLAQVSLTQSPNTLTQTDLLCNIHQTNLRSTHANQTCSVQIKSSVCFRLSEVVERRGHYSDHPGRPSAVCLHQSCCSEHQGSVLQVGGGKV